ncbi:hypothetical protein KBI52_11000 [Microvirga sp. HBU67558]|uniref:hypothetical protein n=1 Tax=Microvirga sp. HBU67558 TaxID=2824562 RepID=UPI001B37DD88|nr:hypothetical protein [Microvirga sp. HBU67558]MBQ0820733.1 hypothetical protein [Microvirga sp. HBU67558]
MREAELFDGTVLEFPDDTPDEVISRVAKEQTLRLQAGRSAPAAGGEPDTAAEPELTAERAAGLAGRAGVQAIPGAIAGLPALAYDGTVGFLQNMGTQLVNVKRRAFGEEEAPYRDPFETTKAVSALGEAGADALGLPKPETPGERIAVAGGQTALEALSGAGLAKVGAKATEGATRRVLTELADAPVTQGVVGLTAGGGAQVAAENDVNPLVGMVGGVALGAGSLAAAQGGGYAAGAGLDAGKRLLAIGDDTQRQLAAERLRAAASDPSAALRELEEGAGAELVPGSKPTTFQATGDVGLGALERDLQTANPEVFAQRRAEQNSARLDHLRTVGGEGDAGEIVSFLRGQLDEIDRVTLGDEAAARSAAEAAAERLRPSDDADGVGRSIRGSMQDAEETARRKETALWNAIDPNGSLTVSTQSAKQIADELYGRMSQAARLGLTSEEKEIANLLRSYKPIEAFRELQDLSSRIKGVMREEMRNRGRTPAYARLAQLNQAIRNGIERSAAEEIAANPTVGNRLTQWFNDWSDATGRSTGEGAGESRALRQGSLSGSRGEEGPFSRGSRSTARNQGVQGQPRQGKALSLGQFIARNGGLPLDPESTARDWGNVTIGGKKLARADGRSVDGYWRTKLIEEGYLPPDADGYASRDVSREVYKLLEDELAGRKTYTAADDMRGSSSGFDVDGREAEFQSASTLLREELQNAGIRPDELHTKAFNQAVESLALGDETDAITAYERAVMALDDEGPVSATYAPREGSQNGNIFDTFRADPEAGARYKAATEATRSRVGTFNKGYAGQVLRSDGMRPAVQDGVLQGFRMSDASVASNAFRPGPTGGERIKALVKAGASPSDISDAAALSLRKMALKEDGTIDPKKFQRWRSAHADALKELPENVRARFSTASLATQALERAIATRKARLDDFNKSVLGKVAKVDPADLTKTIGGILNGRDASAQMGKLVKATRGNAAARDGLRRSVAEFIESRFISNKEVATSGENGIRADAFASFVKDKSGALRQVFSGEDLVRMRAIVDDIRRSERSLHAVKTPGQSNTAQDVASLLDKIADKFGSQSLMAQMFQAAGAAFMTTGGNYKAAVAGATGTGIKAVLGSMRAAGIKKVDDLVLEMMLDPQLAKAALLKAPISNKAAQRVLRQSLERIGKSAATGAGYAAGGVQ